MSMAGAQPGAAPPPPRGTPRQAGRIFGTSGKQRCPVSVSERAGRYTVCVLMPLVTCPWQASLIRRAKFAFEPTFHQRFGAAAALGVESAQAGNPFASLCSQGTLQPAL